LKTRVSSNRDLKSIALFATLLISKKLKEENEGVGKEFKVTIFFNRDSWAISFCIRIRFTFRNGYLASLFLKHGSIYLNRVTEGVCMSKTNNSSFKIFLCFRKNTQQYCLKHSTLCTSKLNLGCKAFWQIERFCCTLDLQWVLHLNLWWITRIRNSSGNNNGPFMYI
jgi:hypothetical protein